MKPFKISQYSDSRETVSNKTTEQYGTIEQPFYCKRIISN